MSTASEDAHSAAPPRGFPESEFEDRTGRAQRLMAERELDALLLTTEPELRYFSGFQSQFWESPTRPWFLIVPLEGRPIAVIPEIGAAGMQETWVEDIRAWPAPQPEDDGISLLVAALREQAGRFGRIGVPLGHETHLRMPASDFALLTDRLGNLEIADSTDILRRLRNVKSPAEIEKIRYVCQLTSGAFEALPSRARTGDSERQVCRKLQIDLLQRGADSSPYLIAASGPGGYDNIIMGPTDRVLAKGDVLIIDTGTTFDGYFCDFDRNFAFGPPSDEAKRAHEVVHRATEAGIATARPGATTSDLWAVMWAILEEGGALGDKVGRLGHGLGMQLTEGPSNKPGDDTPLEPGMVITIEPGMEFAPGKLMVHEENIAITDTGAELLSRRAPPEMPMIS
jgi:Xaa-Pro aminopeptidase